MALVGANVAVAKVLSEALPVALVAFLRCVLACLVLWPLARLRDGAGAAPGRALRLNLALQAVFGTALYNAGLLAGLRLTGALEAGLVLSTLPAVVALGAAAWLREKVPPRAWAAVALAVAGMGALTVARADGSASGGGGSALGNLLVFAGVCGEAVYVLLARRIAGRVPVLTASLWMQAWSAAVLLPFALPDLGAAHALFAAPRLAGLLLFHSLTASVLCVALWYAGLRRVPAGTAGLFTGFLPATAALVAVSVLGEPFSAHHAAGIGLMGASLLLAALARRQGGTE
jgi:drug/metabolite transporter (DMT)-like permease